MSTFYALKDLKVKDKKDKKPEKKKSGKFYALKDLRVKDKPEEKSYFDTALDKLKAGGRGLGQSFFGAGDEIVGGVKAIGDVVGGEDLSNIKELYKKHRDQERKEVEKAYEEHPYATYGAEILGSFVPGTGLGGLLSKADRFRKAGKWGKLGTQAVLEGGLSGYGKSDKEGGIDQLEDAIEGAAWQGGIAGGLKAAPGLGRAVISPKKTAKETFGKLVGLLGDDPEEIIKAYTKDPAKFKRVSNQRLSDIAEHVHKDQRKILKDMLVEDSMKAKEVLEKSGVLFKGKEIAKIYDDLIKKTMDKSGGTIVPGSKAQEQIKDMTQMKDFYSQPAQETVKPKHLKDQVIELAAANLGAYKDPAKFQKYAVYADTDLAKQLREKLKTVEGYEKAMEPAREAGVLKSFADENLGTKDKVRTYLDRDMAARKAAREDKPLPKTSPSVEERKMFANIQEAVADKSGRNIVEEMDLLDLNNQLKKAPKEAAEIVKGMISKLPAGLAFFTLVAKDPYLAGFVSLLTYQGGQLFGNYIEKHGYKHAMSILNDAAQRKGGMIEVKGIPVLSRSATKYALQKMKEDE